MSYGDRVKWTSGIGKVRFGTYIFDFKAKEGFSHVIMDGGQKVDIRKHRLQPVT